MKGWAPWPNFQFEGSNIELLWGPAHSSSKVATFNLGGQMKSWATWPDFQFWGSNEELGQMARLSIWGSNVELLWGPARNVGDFCLKLGAFWWPWEEFWCPLKGILGKDLGRLGGAFWGGFRDSSQASQGNKG